MTNDEKRIILSAIRPLDCGALHCRYCRAGSNNHWQHDEYCLYAQSLQEVDAARAILLATPEPSGWQPRDDHGESGKAFSAALIHQPIPDGEESEPSLNYENPEVLRCGLIHLRHRIDENLDVPHYREYHLEMIDAALRKVGSVSDSIAAVQQAAQVATCCRPNRSGGAFWLCGRERGHEGLCDWVTGSVDTHEICICAAVCFADGKIFHGHRHHNAMAAARENGFNSRVQQDMQGFITTKGRFVGRAEGLALQEAAGIPSARGHYNNRALFSEDLY